MEDGELSVWISMDAHLGFDEVGAGGMWRDLQPFAFPSDGFGKAQTQRC